MKTTRSATKRTEVDTQVIEHLSNLSSAVMDRFLAMQRAIAPDPRLSYPRYRVLSWVDATREVSISEISASLGIARSTASEMIGRMVRDGLVKKKTDSDDARSVVITLTPVGQRLIKRRKKELWDAHSTLVKDLSRDDQHAFVSAFETLERLTRREDGEESID